MATNTYARIASDWRLAGSFVQPEEEEPTGGGGEEPPPIPPPSGITHGEQIPALSGSAEAFLAVPQPDTLPEFTGTFSGTQVIEGRQINGQTRIEAGARITFRNCVFVGSPGAAKSQYTFRVIDGGGAWATLENCLLITRTGFNNETGNGTKSLVMWSDTNLELRQCVVRGGIDGLIAAPPGTPGLIPTGDPDVPNARVLIDECWFGDNERLSGSHSDLFQVDGPERGYVLIRRSRFMGFSLPEGSDTLTTRIANPSTAQMASVCYISTISGTDISNKHHVALKDSWFDGGNYVTQANTSTQESTPMILSGNKYGLRHNFGPTAGDWGQITDCRWGATGITGTGLQVTAGDLIPDSSA